MSEQDDNSTGFAIAIVLAVVAFVITGVLGLAIGTSSQKRAAAAAPQAATALVSVEVAVERIFFASGAEGLPVEAAEIITRVVTVMRERPAARVLISGFHDASGDPALNAELAKKRAQSVHQALVDAGVAAGSLELSKPAETTGGGDEREARRVELQLR